MHEQKFQNALGGLIDMEIGVFLSDNQFIKGILLGVKQDHIVVAVNHNVFYFALQHIQTVTNNTKNNLVSSEIVSYVDKNDLVDVLEALRYNWVSINSLSDQVLFGVLSKITDDYVTIINNSEVLYIPKSYIANINCNICKEQISLINSHKQVEIQACKIEEQITWEHTQNTKEIERIITEEVPGLEIFAREITKDESVSRGQLEEQKAMVEIYAELVKVLKHNLLNRNVEIQRCEEVIKETATQSFVVQQDLKSYGQIDSTVVEMQVCQVEEQVVGEHVRTIDETTFTHNLQASLKEGIEFENVAKEFPIDSSRLVKHDILECSFEEQLLPIESRVNRKKKRVLLTAWGTMNSEQRAIVSHNSFTEKNELRDNEVDSGKLEQYTDPDNSLIQPFHDQYSNEEVAVFEEKCETAETTTFQLPITRITPKIEKEMLEKQYYALMKQAETNCFHMAERHMSLSEEGQYLALMKHAAKRYQEFKD